MTKGNCDNDNDDVTPIDDLLIKVKLFAIGGALLPGFACYFCIAYTYAFHFQRIQNFTCPSCPDMHSMLPPVSYIIGVWEPTRSVWLFVMFLHFPARLFYPFLYNQLFKMGNSEHTDSRWFIILHNCFIKTMLLEVFALLTITVFDAVSHFYIHASAYCVWLIMLNFNMFASAVLQFASGVRKFSTRLNRLFYIKLVMFFTGGILSLSTAFTYPYSTTLCSQSLYMMFSMAEYLLVGINSLFYFLIYWDCAKVRIGLTAHGLEALGMSKEKHEKKAKNILFCINSRRK